MKKLIVMAAFAVAGLVNAQTGFKAGVHAGLPIGTLKEFYSFNVGVDVAYIFHKADKYEIGATTGFTTTTGKTIDGYKIPALSYIPLALTASYKLADSFSIGTDLGWGFATSEGGGSGFYFQPKVNYLLGETSEIYLGYKNLKVEGGYLSAIALGYNYNF